MRPRSSSLLAAAAMSSRPFYRGGRNQYRRGFSDKAYDNYGSDQFVTGDAHIRSVPDDNRGRGGFDVRPRPHNYRPPPELNHNFRPFPYQQMQFEPSMPPRFDQNQSFRPPPELNSHFPRPKQFGPPSPNRPMASNQNQQLRPQFKKPVDYRNWEYARKRPPRDCERFTVLSYNILADYLAIDHWSKLYFHIPPHMIGWEWRKRNIIFELGLWSADILCFQEVDRFQDLEEELKVKGYCGTWKMRTGNPVDGCAIFWRSSRFKLLHEESIEFNKLGLRDNVAQICVLERVDQNTKRYKRAVGASTGGSSKVVVGNIHVLYNPRRGEIKLGQVRVFLDRAYAVSKLWNDAPVVLCGDFNCTPKSPLYNFILEQKLELFGLPRNKLSGQASAEIRLPRRFTPNLSNRPINVPTVIEDMEGKHLNIPTDNLVQAPIMTDARKVEQSEAPLNILKSNGLDSNNGDAPAQRNLSEPHCISSVLPDSSASCGVEDKDEKRPYNDEASHIPSTEHHQSNLCDKNEILNGGADIHDHHCSTKSFQEPAGAGNLKSDLASSDTIDKTSLHNVPESADEGSMEHFSSLGVTNKNLCRTSHEVEISTSNHFLLDEKIDDDLFGKVIEAEESGTPGEDCTSFLSKLHGDVHIPSKFNHDSKFDSSECIGSNQHVSISENQELSPYVGVLSNYPGVGFGQVDVERTTYDPSTWTPMDIEAATGCADCTVMESPLKLRSTYSEVEDSSGTRDSSGEPLVTSYNRCFLGTVDYIWRSEGLQTVRALAPIPKHAMQLTSGFPTKKWGSDHMALVSELAFTKKTDSQVEDL